MTLTHTLHHDEINRRYSIGNLAKWEVLRKSGTKLADVQLVAVSDHGTHGKLVATVYHRNATTVVGEAEMWRDNDEGAFTRDELMSAWGTAYARAVDKLKTPPPSATLQDVYDFADALRRAQVGNVEGFISLVTGQKVDVSTPVAQLARSLVSLVHGDGRVSRQVAQRGLGQHIDFNTVASLVGNARRKQTADVARLLALLSGEPLVSNRCRELAKCLVDSIDNPQTRMAELGGPVEAGDFVETDGGIRWLVDEVMVRREKVVGYVLLNTTGERLHPASDPIRLVAKGVVRHT
jgi:hypothetical protein